MNDWLTSVPLWSVFFGIGVLLLAAEMLTLTFDLLWLALGALTGALVAWLVPAAPAWVPTLAAVITGLLLLTVGRRWARGQRQQPGFQEPMDLLIGREAEVLQPILPPRLGMVRSGNETWSATADTPISLGTIVRITARSSTVVKVELVNNST